jgi:subtilisin family serine protease
MRSTEIVAAFALAIAIFPGKSFAESTKQFNQITRPQIEAIERQKASRNRAEKKVDSRLLNAVREQKRGFILRRDKGLRSNLSVQPDGRVAIDLKLRTPNPSNGLMKDIAKRGGEVDESSPEDSIISARVPLNAILPLASRPDVFGIKQTPQPHSNQQMRVRLPDEEGDVAHEADIARAKYRVSGAGVKVCVVAANVAHLKEAEDAKSVSRVTVLEDKEGKRQDGPTILPSEGNGEGTAMLEIVHRLAPDASLYFATGRGDKPNPITMSKNIRGLRDKGCNIIVDDLSYDAESPFQDGIIAKAVNDVSTTGVLYFSSAANNGNLVHGTSGTWEGDFAASDHLIKGLSKGAKVHSFNQRTLHGWENVLYGPTPNDNDPAHAQRTAIELFWNDPLGKSKNDYDLYVYSTKTGEVVDSSTTNVSDGARDPYQYVHAGPNTKIVIVKSRTAARRHLYLVANGQRLKFATDGATHGHNASRAPNAFSVAATSAFNSGGPFHAGANVKVESFSADGPRRMYFDKQGAPITAHDYSSRGGKRISKPDITGADGIATDVPGYERFWGTSAAAPHAAAIAALILSYRLSFTPAQVRTCLTSSALDIEAPGWDTVSGSGIAMASTALACAEAMSSSAGRW